MVIWLTGLSGSGKSTIAKSLVDNLKPFLPGLVILDGDVIRELFGSDLGFDVRSRLIQIQRIQVLIKILVAQEIPIVVAALYSNSEILKFNRDSFQPYFEVFVDAPMEVLESRDTKGIYSRARAGDEVNVVGIDIPWERPQNPDLVVKTHTTSLNDIVLQIIRLNPLLRDYAKYFTNGTLK